MSFISVKNITKTFKVTKRNSGLKNSLKSFFKRDYNFIDAVKDISFDSGYQLHINFVDMNHDKKENIKKIYNIMMNTKL